MCLDELAACCSAQPLHPNGLRHWLLRKSKYISAVCRQISAEESLWKQPDKLLLHQATLHLVPELLAARCKSR
jgi:hypothetical protein